ncbi:MAG: hypothetical protein ACJ8F7_06725 [Gemmataceae bacterium]
MSIQVLPPTEPHGQFADVSADRRAPSVGGRNARVQTLLVLVMLPGLVLTAVFAALWWAGFPVERPVVMSVGVLLTAAALNFVGEALRPGSTQVRWSPRPGLVVMPPSRVTSLGAGLWFGAIGVAFLGRDWLTESIVAGIMGAAIAGVALALVGGWLARRRARAPRAMQTALLEYADRHGGCFPKGEASPEASLGLLHRENPELVTANVLRGRAGPEAGEPLTPQSSGWHYAEGLRRFDDSRLALAWEKAAPSCSDALLFGKGRFVVSVGGVAEYVLAERWETFLAEQERLRAAIRR